jgi:N utilization substance protein B
VVQAPLFSTRRKTKVIALQALYEVDAVDHDPIQVLDRLMVEADLPASARQVTREMVRGVVENRRELDRIITELAPSWPVSQIAAVDRSLLRLAIYELMFSRQAPPKVTVNEAVDLARAFGSESSRKFVNGVLGSVMEMVEA